MHWKDDVTRLVGKKTTQRKKRCYKECKVIMVGLEYWDNFREAMLTCMLVLVHMAENVETGMSQAFSFINYFKDFVNALDHNLYYFFAMVVRIIIAEIIMSLLSVLL